MVLTTRNRKILGVDHSKGTKDVVLGKLSERLAGYSSCDDTQQKVVCVA
jgi:hypothetical protein